MPEHSTEDAFQLPQKFPCAFCWEDRKEGSRRRWVCTGKCGEPALVGYEQDSVPPTQDAVTLPHHYARFKIEPIRFIVENALDFIVGNIVKYAVRADAKNGKEDVKKIIRYAVMLIKRDYNKDPNWWGPDAKLAEYLKAL